MKFSILILLIALLLVQIVPSWRSRVYVASEGEGLKTPWLMVVCIVVLGYLWYHFVFRYNF